MTTWVRLGRGVVLLALLLTACTPAPESDGTDRRAADSPPYRVLHLPQPRAVHHATLLADGRVLFTGGCTLPGCEGFEQAKVTDVFNPDLGEFAPGPTMRQPRAGGTATLLRDGRVLLTGGYPGEGLPPTDTAEVFDPQTDSFVSVGTMTDARADQSSTPLPDGRVLIAGGISVTGDVLATTEIFDPRTDSFTAGSGLSEPRAGQSAVALGDRVVLVGGTHSSRALSSTDVFAAGTWATGPELVTARVKLAAVALPPGRVLVVGGASSTEGRTKIASTEIVDLRSGDARLGPRLSEGEYKLDGAVATLPGGRIAVAGGDKVNLYDPRTNTMTVLDEPSMGARSFLSATPVGRDQLLVAGGYDSTIVPTEQAWLIPVS